MLRALAACALLAAGGCAPGLKTSPEAKPWPPLAQDPAETGRDLDRWPGWRGVNGQGIAPGGNPPIRFGSESGLRWRVAVAPGNSSPAIWGDQIFLSAALDAAEPATLGVLAIDRRDGRELWRAPAGPAKGATHQKNGHASATPVTDGRHVVAFFGDTGLFCFDTAGEPLWHVRLGRFEHQWGTASSPVLYQDLVIQLCDSEQESWLAALKLSDGSLVWRVPRASKSCWTTPVLVGAPAKQGPRAELIVNGTGPEGVSVGSVTAYRPEDGRQLWRVPGTTTLTTPTLLVGGDLVFSLTGRNGPMMALRPGEVPDADRVVWQTHRGGPYIPSGVLYRNRLYVLTDAGVLGCYNPGNGQLLGQTRIRGPFTASLIAAAGRLYAVSERGTVYVLAAGETPEVLAEHPLGERVLATPAIVEGDLVLRTERALYCWKPASP